VVAHEPRDSAEIAARGIYFGISHKKSNEKRQIDWANPRAFRSTLNLNVT